MLKRDANNLRYDDPAGRLSVLVTWRRIPPYVPLVREIRFYRRGNADKIPQRRDWTLYISLTVGGLFIERWTGRIRGR